MKTYGTSQPAARLEARPWSRIAERLEATKTPPDRARRALPLVLAIVVASLSLGVWELLNFQGPASSLEVAIVLVGLAFLAETMPYYSEDRGAAGSVAFIPYAAAVYCFPDARLVPLVAAAQILVQLWHRRAPLKSLFNAAQFTLSVEVSLAVVQAVGVPHFSMGTQPFAESLASWALPALASFGALVLVNKLCVGAVVAVVSGQKFTEMLLGSARQVLTLSALQVVLALYLGWLSSSLGVLGAAGMVLPIIAVRQLARTTIQLTKVTEELLDLMVAAIEARDPYTSGHSRRVSESAVTIAQALGLKPADVERVQVAALLHDVGKIHEEFARVLAKEGRLTPEEWEIMKRHPVRSAELVGLVTTLKDVVPGVRHHHENWDGTGYPAGIKGEAIPLASRIIMFADTLDAITTDRPYRKALNPEEARREFVKFRGRQFDPSICDVVVSESVWPTLYAAANRVQASGVIDPASVA